MFGKTVQHMNEDLGEEMLWGEDALLDAPFCGERRSEKKAKTHAFTGPK